MRQFRPYPEKDSKLVAMDLGGPDFSSSSRDDDPSSSLNLVTTNEMGFVRAWKVDCSSPQAFAEPSAYKEHAVHREQVTDSVRIGSNSDQNTPCYHI